MKKRGIGCLMALVMLCGLLTGCGGSKEKENMKMYFILKKKIEHGYSFIHEYLYHELLKPQYKKK